MRVSVGAPDPAADLVELREPEAVGAVDDQGVGVGDVQAVLDDGGADQDVHVSVHETEHHLVELPPAHLAVGDGDGRAGRQRAHLLGRAVDGLNAVVEEEDLAAPVELPPKAVVQDVVVPGNDMSGDGDPVAGRSPNQRKVAQAGE